MVMTWSCGGRDQSLSSLLKKIIESLANFPKTQKGGGEKFAWGTTKKAFCQKITLLGHIDINIIEMCFVIGKL